MLYIAEVRRIGTDFATLMVEMRTWLDHNGINSSVFDHSSGGPGIAFRVGFRREEDALAFARAFRGWLNNGDDPDGADLWRISEPEP
jgi:hypothetical protein